MKYLITAITFLILTAISCKKNKDDQKDQLPPATQIGANTFGCLVNGKVYIPKGYSGTGTPNPKISFDFFNNNTFFSIFYVNDRFFPSGKKHIYYLFYRESGTTTQNLPNRKIFELDTQVR